MTETTASPRPPGRPRSRVDAAVFAATLRTVEELGYTRATVDRIGAAAGVAKTTIYRRWPSKGELITACLVDAFGPLPLRGDNREEDLAAAIRFGAAKIGEPGVGAAFAGVFTDAVSDPALREVLRTRLQDPYRLVLQDLLGEPEDRVLFIVDVVIGTLLHRMGITGEPMVETDVDSLVEMVLATLRQSLPRATSRMSLTDQRVRRGVPSRRVGRRRCHERHGHRARVHRDLGAGLIVRNDLETNGDGGFLTLSVTPHNGCVLASDSDGNGTLNVERKARVRRRYICVCAGKARGSTPNTAPMVPRGKRSGPPNSGDGETTGIAEFRDLELS